MYEQGVAWWFGYGKFRPMIGEYENAKFLDDLYDETGNITNCRKFDLMRVFIEVEKIDIADGNDETWTVRAVENVNRQLAADRMQGVDEPTFVETKVLDMPQTGFLNPLIKAINGIKTAIWSGALGFVKVMWGAIDSFGVFIGLPSGFFSRITDFIIMIPDIIIKLVENIDMVITYSVTLLDQIFSFVFVAIPRLFWLLAELTFTFVTFWTSISSMLTGGWTGVSNIWVEWNVGDWIQLFLYAIFPAWQVNRIFTSKTPMETARNDLKF